MEVGQRVSWQWVQNLIVVGVVEGVAVLATDIPSYFAVSESGIKPISRDEAETMLQPPKSHKRRYIESLIADARWLFRNRKTF